ncbi:MAG: HNH endonuclease [Lachnospiraceae bacterium]|nr:HNH endonuclease [Lachnospiraceae bacterium]
MKKAEGRTKNYYVFDTLSQHILWKHMTPEELDEVRKNKLALSMVKRDKHGKIVRKIYSEDTRKLIYLNAHGKCELCGRNILLEDMTIDHINPLSMGGEDDVENLACTCYPCNLFKGNILPDDFMERITEIFMYQTEKKGKISLKWKIVHRLLSSVR